MNASAVAVHLYADNTSLVTNNLTRQTLGRQVDDVTSKTENRFGFNKLKINTNKT